MKQFPMHRIARQLLVLILVLSFLPARTRAAEPAPESGDDLQTIFEGGIPDDLADLKAMEKHVQELAKKVIPCTVGVAVGNAQGSGVIISEDGYVLTAGHVSGRPNRNVQLTLPDGKKVRGKTLGQNRGIDSGLIKITDEGKWPHLQMGDSSKLQQGQWIVGTGHPNGYQEGRKPVLRLGRVLANHSSVIVTDCTLVSGDSGGPLFDMDGKVIGIHSRIDNPLTSNMHVPVNTYLETWDRLAKGDSWGNLPGRGPFIGVQGDPEADNAKIARVYPKTPAAKAGMKVGDVITKFDGKDIPDFATLATLVGKKKPGDKVKVEVLRNDKTQRFNIVIGRRG